MCLGGYSSIPVGESGFFFVSHSCHVDPFTFHISLPSLKFTISIHLSQTQVNYTSLSFVYKEQDSSELNRTRLASSKPNLKQAKFKIT